MYLYLTYPSQSYDYNETEKTIFFPVLAGEKYSND